MAETAKVLNPSRIVVLPDLDAGCSLVDACPAPQVRAFLERHPDHVIVSYINTSVEVKAESDICALRATPFDRQFDPGGQADSVPADINLGNYVKQQTGGKNMKFRQGACIFHATFAARRLTSARAEHPNALVAAHPECPPDVLAMADSIGSTSAIIDWCVTAPGRSHRHDRSACAICCACARTDKKFYFRR